jgi:hypothetical protein
MKDFDKWYGGLVRTVEVFTKVKKVKPGPGLEGMRRLLGEVLETFKRLLKEAEKK